MKHPLLVEEHSQDELMNLFLKEIIRSNPRIRLGVRLTGPCARVWEGRYFEETIAPDVVKLDIMVPHVEKPSEVVMAQSVKVPLTDDFSRWATYEYKYLYPYEISIPHAKWLKDVKVGDTINAMDDEWQVSPVTVTQEIIDIHSYAIFRYAPGN